MCVGRGKVSEVIIRVKIQKISLFYKVFGGGG